MRRIKHFLMFMAGLILTGLPLKAQYEETTDKTSSPYFFIRNGDPDTECFPLKATSAEVSISGVIADVHLFQTYRNEGKKTIEAIYIFPASSRAAVYHMVMHIGEREITAVVQPRDLARQNYEAAKRNGQTVSLLEQERPNIFTMNVANILPGDEVNVEMHYTELLIPENNIYSFVLPAVVGPRYTGKDGQGRNTDPWAANPYLEEGVTPEYSWEVKVQITAGMPIKALHSPSHEIITAFKGRSAASVWLKNKEAFQGDRDFILEYRLAGNRIETGLLLYRGKEENFFLAMVQPPVSIRPEMIPPREYIFIVDISGSMHGFPLDISKKLMKELTGELGPAERFNIVTFAGGSATFASSPVLATGENKAKALAFINSLQGSGGTELLPAIRKAMSIPAGEGFARSFVILTDGYVTVEKETFAYIRNHLNDANFFAFGIGSSVNRYLIEGIAHAGMGKDFVVIKPTEAAKAAKQFKAYVSTPVLTGIRVSYKGFTVNDQIPGDIPDLLGARPLIFFGKWNGDPAGEIRITGNGSKFSTTLKVSGRKPAKGNAVLAYLWAREKIRILDDFGDYRTDEKEQKEEITALGLKYNLLTRFTSFIALDSEIRNTSGEFSTVVQPLPLPQGVSNYAVGSAIGKKSLRFYGSSPAPNRSGSSEFTVYETELTDNLLPEMEGKTIHAFKPVTFKGGPDALKNFLKSNVIIPEDLKIQGVHGVVFARVFIDSEGKVEKIVIVRSLNPAADREARRVLKQTSGLWQPARQNGKKVKASIVIPVKFQVRKTS